MKEKERLKNYLRMMPKTKSLSDSEGHGYFHFNVQKAARENGLFLKRVVLSQRSWGTQSSFRVMNIK